MHLTILILLALWTQQTPTAAVEGVVLRAGTDQPVPKAVVELTGGDRSQAFAVAAGADGSFQFPSVPPGTYRLAVSRAGYLDSGYGQRGPSGSGTALVVKAGQSIKDIRLTLIAAGALSGRVYDYSGEPLANVPVRAMRYSYATGQRTLTLVKVDTTDDRGEYRLFWLPPGVYYVNAGQQGRAGEGMIISGDGATHRMVRIDSSTGVVQVDGRPAAEKLGEADAPVFYPGTADAGAASSINVRSGADIGGIDFSLVRAKTRTVRGFVIDGLTGQPATSASVVLAPRQVSITGALAARPVFDGTFQVTGVLPGSYMLIATYRSPAGDGAFRLMGARLPIEVGNADVDRLSLVLAPTQDIRGEVVTEGAPSDPTDFGQPIISLKNEIAGAPGRAAQAYAQFERDGRFVINDLIEGDYRVSVNNLPKGAYVKSIRFGAADALNNSLHFDPRSVERLAVVLGANSGVIEGVALSRKREPLPNTAVAIVPNAAQRDRADLYKSAYTDDSGRFQIQGVPPGDYLIFAWEDIEDGMWRDPDFIRRVEGSGRPIRLGEGGRENVELTAIPYEF